MVAATPSVRALSSTMRTLSGCCRALSIHPALPNSTSMRSVPAETREVVVWMSSWPVFTWGQGMSNSSVEPVLRDWRICFISRITFRLIQNRLDSALASATQTASWHPDCAGHANLFALHLGRVGLALGAISPGRRGQSGRQSAPPVPEEHWRTVIKIVHNYSMKVGLQQAPGHCANLCSQCRRWRLLS